MFRDFKTQSSIGYAFDDDPLNTKTGTIRNKNNIQMKTSLQRIS